MTTRRTGPVHRAVYIVWILTMKNVSGGWLWRNMELLLLKQAEGNGLPSVGKRCETVYRLFCATITSCWTHNGQWRQLKTYLFGQFRRCGVPIFLTPSYLHIYWFSLKNNKLIRYKFKKKWMIHSKRCFSRQFYPVSSFSYSCPR